MGGPAFHVPHMPYCPAPPFLLLPLTRVTSATSNAFSLAFTPTPNAHAGERTHSQDPPPPPRHHPGRCSPVRRSLSSPPRRAQVPGCQLIMKVPRSFAIRTLSFRHPGARAHEGPDLSLLGKCRHITNGVPRRLVPPRPQHLVSFHPFKVPLQYRNCTKYLLSRIIR